MTDKPSAIKKNDLIFREKSDNYSREAVNSRVAWLEKKCSTKMSNVSEYKFDPDQIKGNIENPIGAIEVPLGIAGPILVNGEYARGQYYVPFATTEGALVESYERGMIVLTRAGGANTRIRSDCIHITPVFVLNDTLDAHKFAGWIDANFSKLKKEAEKSTKHGKLLEVKSYVTGCRVYLCFIYFTADAMGLNMINISTENVCRLICGAYPVKKYYLRSNLSADKKASFRNFVEGYGKDVSVDCLIPRKVIKRFLHSTPEDMYDFWYSSVLGSMQAGMVGMNAHYGNALASIFIACGQDVAQITNASHGLSMCEVTEDGDYYASLRLPCIVVGTVGGGTRLPGQQECLRLMGCDGSGHAKRFAEIIAAVLLAGEISLCAALASGDFIKPHAEKHLFLKKKEEGSCY